jgi:hypothetical protein
LQWKARYRLTASLVRWSCCLWQAVFTVAWQLLGVFFLGLDGNRRLEARKKHFSGRVGRYRICSGHAMKRSRAPKFLVSLVIALLVSGCLPLLHADLVLRLRAADYVPGTGTWTDTSGMGNDATAPSAAATPTLQLNQGPNNASAVRFDGNDSLNLASSISETAAGAGFTAFALIRPDGIGTLFAGQAGSFQWRVAGTGVQQALRSSQAGLGFGSAVLPAGSSAAFSLLSVRVNGSGVVDGYRYNGVSDGDTTGSAFPVVTTGIGRKFTGATEFFTGDIVELRIYDNQLSLSEIMNVENQLMIPEPSSLALLGLGALLLLCNRARQR